MKYVLTLCLLLTFTAHSADKELQKKLGDYLKILRACPADSAVPQAIFEQMRSFQGTDLEKHAVDGLTKEYLYRGAAMINICRQEAYAVIKKESTEKQAEIKGKLASLRALGELSETNIDKANKLLKEIMNSFIPESIKWSEKVNKERRLFTSLKSAITRLNSSAELAEFSTLEFIAKAAACPLTLKNKTMAANYKAISSIPFQSSAAAYQINLIRTFYGKNALAIDPKLNYVAQFHSKDMKDNNYLAHESPTDGMKTLSDRARKVKTTASEEIIGRGTSDVMKLNWAYLRRYKNAKHYFGPWSRIGVGFYSKHWTQVFGK